MPNAFTAISFRMKMRYAGVPSSPGSELAVLPHIYTRERMGLEAGDRLPRCHELVIGCVQLDLRKAEILRHRFSILCFIRLHSYEEFQICSGSIGCHDKAPFLYKIPNGSLLRELAAP